MISYEQIRNELSFIPKDNEEPIVQWPCLQDSSLRDLLLSMYQGRLFPNRFLHQLCKAALHASIEPFELRPIHGYKSFIVLKGLIQIVKISVRGAVTDSKFEKGAFFSVNSKQNSKLIGLEESEVLQLQFSTIRQLNNMLMERQKSQLKHIFKTLFPSHFSSMSRLGIQFKLLPPNSSVYREGEQTKFLFFLAYGEAVQFSNEQPHRHKYIAPCCFGQKQIIAGSQTRLYSVKNIVTSLLLCVNLVSADIEHLGLKELLQNRYPTCPGLKRAKQLLNSTGSKRPKKKWVHRQKLKMAKGLGISQPFQKERYFRVKLQQMTSSLFPSHFYSTSSYDMSKSIVNKLDRIASQAHDLKLTPCEARNARPPPSLPPFSQRFRVTARKEQKEKYYWMNGTRVKFGKKYSQCVQAKYLWMSYETSQILNNI